MKKQSILRNQKALMGASAALVLTAGGGCGFNCRQDRDENTRDELLELVDELLAEWLADCGDDAACKAAAIQRHQELETSIIEWYLKRAENDHRPTNETRDILDRIREIIRDLGNLPLSESLIGYTGSVVGDGEIVVITSIPIDAEPVGFNDESAQQSSGGVETTTATTTDAAAGVGEAITGSTGGVVIAQQTTILRGVYTVQIESGPTFSAGNYEFVYNFVVGKSKALNDLNVRTLTSGSATITGTPLVFELDADVGKSRLILGSNGRGILRLSGRIVSADPDGSVPFNLPLKYDLPIEETPNGDFVIQSESGVDLNIMANTKPSWFVDYDNNGAIEGVDRTLYIADHAAGEPRTDLNADEVFDGLDFARYDDSTSRALSRLSFLAAQGVEGAD